MTEKDLQWVACVTYARAAGAYHIDQAEKYARVALAIDPTDYTFSGPPVDLHHAWARIDQLAREDTP